jgi:hypothetical protein
MSARAPARRDQRLAHILKRLLPPSRTVSAATTETTGPTREDGAMLFRETGGVISACRLAHAESYTSFRNGTPSDLCPSAPYVVTLFRFDASKRCWSLPHSLAPWLADF